MSNHSADRYYNFVSYNDKLEMSRKAGHENNLPLMQNRPRNEIFFCQIANEFQTS